MNASNGANLGCCGCHSSVFQISLPPVRGGHFDVRVRRVNRSFGSPWPRTQNRMRTIFARSTLSHSRFRVAGKSFALPCPQRHKSRARMTCWHLPTRSGRRLRPPPKLQPGTATLRWSRPPAPKERVEGTCASSASRLSRTVPVSAAGLRLPDAIRRRDQNRISLRGSLESADISASGAKPAPPREHHSCQRSVLNCCPSCAAPP